ncbi:unnamed protein product, partial [Ectocarpus sp. 12 AP-2014]
RNIRRQRGGGNRGRDGGDRRRVRDLREAGGGDDLGQHSAGQRIQPGPDHGVLARVRGEQRDYRRGLRLRRHLPGGYGLMIARDTSLVKVDRLRQLR